MKVDIVVDSAEVRSMMVDRLVELAAAMGVNLDPIAIKVEVKSKQNYREHEWETGDVRVRVEINASARQGVSNDLRSL